MPKFNAGDAISFELPYNNSKGEKVTVPGICTEDSYLGSRVNRATGSNVPTEVVEVLSFHDIPAEDSRDGIAKSYYKRQIQSCSWMSYRTVAVAGLDDKTEEELDAAVAKSLADIQQQTTRVRVALAENAVKPKATFGRATAPALVPVK